MVAGPAHRRTRYRGREQQKEMPDPMSGDAGDLAEAGLYAGDFASLGASVYAAEPTNQHNRSGDG